MLKTTKSRKIIVIILGIVVFLLAIICIMLLVNLNKVNSVNNKYKSELKENNIVYGISIVDQIYIYGTHMNIYGKISDFYDIEEMSMVLYDESVAKTYNLEYEYIDDVVSYHLSDNINGGIDLEDIDIGNYRVLIKVKSNGKTYYYSLYNKTTYNFMDYYTITRNNKNKHITIESTLTNIKVNVKKCKLPNDVYDITIDAGHGGDDSGAIKNDVYESYINLEVALKVKEYLENLGLKVILTRDGNYNPGNIPGISAYGKGGRISIGYESKSKFFISIHSNNLPLNPSTNGVEIYTSDNNSKELAKIFADNIVKEVGINYSTKKYQKVDNGVYVRNFTTSEIKDLKKEFSKKGYKMYETITTKTQYYYVIRETGGIITGSYVDGRNKSYAANDYMNSNVGLDGYLIEMGYMTNSNDLKLLLNKKDEYAKAISNSIKEYLNITN